MKNAALDNKTIMVCVTGQRSCDQLIARGVERRGEKGKVHVVHCVETGKNFMNTHPQGQVVRLPQGVMLHGLQHGGFRQQKAGALQLLLPLACQLFRRDVPLRGEDATLLFYISVKQLSLSGC